MNFLKPLTFLLILSFLIPLTVRGQITIPNPLEAETIEELIDNIIDFIFLISLAIAPIMILVAGFLFLTAGGNPQKVSQAKNLILYTVIGLAIILLAKGLIAVLKSVLGGAE